MADEDVADVAEAPEPETPSAEGAPEGEETEETTSEESEGEDAPPDEQSEDGEEPAGGDDEDEAWKNLTKKFDHLKSERDRKAAIGRAYWEKTRYASQTRKELEEAKAKLASLEKPEPKADEPPKAPPPEIAKLDERIQGLVAKDNSLIQGQQDLLGKLRSVDEEIVRWKTKAEDADEYNKALYEQKVETATLKKDSMLQRWADINDRRQQLSYDVDRLMSDRAWVEQFVRNEEQRKVLEAKTDQEFRQNFRGFVNEQIEEIATELGAPAVKGLREDLRETVRDKLTVAFWKMQGKVDEVDVPELIRKHVEQYLKRTDLVGRTKFADASKKKLAVASRGTAPRPDTTAPKPAPGKPVRIAQMSQGELSSGMAKARNYLASRGL